MDLWATKNQQEREDEEAERLVRPAPKLKPPRRDRRRERTDADRDDDLIDEDNSDPDLSTNYKDIGGAVLERFAKRTKLLTVRNKETGKVVKVTPEGLKKSPGKYEEIKPKDKAKDEDAPPKDAPSPRTRGPQKARPPEDKPEKTPPPKEEKDKPAKAEEKGEPEQAPSKKEEKPKEKGEEGEAADEEPEEPSEAKKAGIGEPKREEPSEADWIESMDLIQDTFPPDVANQMLEQSIHPDDVREMVVAYKAAQKALPVGKTAEDIQSFAKKVGSFYETDSDRVKPPAKWKNAEGEEVDFGELPPDEQAKAYRQHQNQVVAMSLAAKDQLTTALSFPNALGTPRIPPELADSLASITLLGKGDVDPKQMKALVSKTFEQGIASGGDKPIDKKVAKKLLESVTPETAKIAKAYLQGQDYNHAKSKFLGGGAEAISERDSPRGIVRGLKKAGKFFEERAKDYGDDKHEASTNFRVKVLSKLRKLDPDKYKEVRAIFDKEESAAYDKKLKAYKKAQKDWEKRKQEYESSVDSPYREKPFEDPPTPPVKPARYVGKSKEGDKEMVESLLDRVKTASARGQKFIFTYPSGEAMDRIPNKAAVYHGIDPADNDAGPYPEWSQPFPDEIGEAQHELILAEAKSWLKQPILARPVKGFERDTQLRAALDLGLKTSGYDRHVTPQLYDKLLARLAGRPEPGLGETLTKLSDNRTSSCPTVQEENPVNASQAVRKFAADLAETNPKIAYELNELADSFDQPAADSTPKAASEAPKDERYAKLRSQVIRTAAADAEAKKVLMPILQAIKDLG